MTVRVRTCAEAKATVTCVRIHVSSCAVTTAGQAPPSSPAEGEAAGHGHGAGGKLAREGACPCEDPSIPMGGRKPQQEGGL